MLYLHHISVLTPTRRIEDGAVLVEGERIRAVGPAGEVACPPGARILDGGGGLLAPGFIDLQFNGAFGYDFTVEPQTIWDVAARLPQHGVTAFLPTLVTAPPETVSTAQAVVQRVLPAPFRGATPLGLHIEGPFLNPEKRGAHNPAYMRRPSLDVIATWSPESGVRLVTLAPELPGALEVIRALHARGVVVAGGHSMAEYAEALAGAEAGLTYATHLFNAMRPLDHQSPGLIAALLNDPRIIIGLIPDGVHLHPAIVNLIWRNAGAARVNLVTDAMAALGMPPGNYRIGDVTATVNGVSARLGDGRLAGSLLSLDMAVRNFIAFTGCAVEDAVRAVTEVPARLLGLRDRGQLAPGFRADMVLLASDLQVAATYCAGVEAYASSEVRQGSWD